MNNLGPPTVAAMLLASIACSEVADDVADDVCATSADGPAVVVEVLGASGEPAAFGVSGVARDGEYVDSLAPLGDDGSFTRVGAADSRPGIYDLTLGREGYTGWSQSDVVVRDGCPITTTTVTAHLQVANPSVLAVIERSAIPTDEWVYYELRNLSPDTVQASICHGAPRADFERLESGTWVVRWKVAHFCDARGGGTGLLATSEYLVGHVALDPGRYRLVARYNALGAAPESDSTYSGEFTVCETGVECSHTQ